MSVYHVTWESWEEGTVEIEASTKEEARQLFDDEYVGCLEADSEGMDIIEVEEVTPSDDDEET